MKKNILVWATIFAIGIFLGSFLLSGYNIHGMVTADDFVLSSDSMKHMIMSAGDYRCCLENPCSYCLKEGECDCMDDIMSGKHPCGECIGEILEGHGNKFLSKYFASAIAEKVGESHLDELKQIIYEKYDIEVSEQL